MFKSNMVVLYFCSLFLLILGQSGLCYSEERKSIKTEAQIAWSELNGETHQIFFSQKQGKIWTPKKQLSADNRIHLIPSLSSDGADHTWVVWAASDGIETRLMFARYDGKNWSESSELPTGMISNTAPAITVDKDGTPWVVWAGFDGQDDEIFFTRWNGTGWDIPVRIHEDNAVPDILPGIFIGSNGFPLVRWSGFDGGTYHSYLSQWRGKDWSNKAAENQFLDNNSEGDELIKISASEIADIVKEPKNVSVYFPKQTVGNRSFLLRDRLKSLSNRLD